MSAFDNDQGRSYGLYDDGYSDAIRFRLLPKTPWFDVRLEKFFRFLCLTVPLMYVWVYVNFNFLTCVFMATVFAYFISDTIGGAWMIFHVFYQSTVLAGFVVTFGSFYVEYSGDKDPWVIYALVMVATTVFVFPTIGTKVGATTSTCLILIEETSINIFGAAYGYHDVEDLTIGLWDSWAKQLIGALIFVGAACVVYLLVIPIRMVRGQMHASMSEVFMGLGKVMGQLRALHATFAGGATDVEAADAVSSSAIQLARAAQKITKLAPLATMFEPWALHPQYAPVPGRLWSAMHADVSCTALHILTLAWCLGTTRSLKGVPPAPKLANDTDTGTGKGAPGPALWDGSAASAMDQIAGAIAEQQQHFMFACGDAMRYSRRGQEKDRLVAIESSPILFADIPKERNGLYIPTPDCQQQLQEARAQADQLAAEGLAMLRNVPTTDPEALVRQCRPWILLLSLAAEDEMHPAAAVQEALAAQATPDWKAWAKMLFLNTWGFGGWVMIFKLTLQNWLLFLMPWKWSPGWWNKVGNRYRLQMFVGFACLFSMVVAISFAYPNDPHRLKFGAWSIVAFIIVFQAGDTAEIIVQKAFFRAVGSVLGCLLSWPVLLCPKEVYPGLLALGISLCAAFQQCPQSRIPVSPWISQFFNGGMFSFIICASAFVPGELSAFDAFWTRAIAQVAGSVVAALTALLVLPKFSFPLMAEARREINKLIVRCSDHLLGTVNAALTGGPGPDTDAVAPDAFLGILDAYLGTLGKCDAFPMTAPFCAAEHGRVLGLVVSTVMMLAIERATARVLDTPMHPRLRVLLPELHRCLYGVLQLLLRLHDPEARPAPEERAARARAEQLQVRQLLLGVLQVHRACDAPEILRWLKIAVLMDVICEAYAAPGAPAGRDAPAWLLDPVLAHVHLHPPHLHPNSPAAAFGGPAPGAALYPDPMVLPVYAPAPSPPHPVQFAPYAPVYY